ncbi:YraN family protein [soil metagenome]
MANNRDTGNLGELLAEEYFVKKGYIILHRNWRHKQLEVDMIAHKNNMLHFIEVKSRTSSDFGYPEENVTKQKIKFLIDASAEFLYQYPQWKRIQFDVLAIVMKPGNEPEYFLIEDVYL